MSAKERKSAAKHRHKQIACATRGGTASRATEDEAIALALEQDAALTFLYIVDAHFAAGLSGKLTLETVEDELRHIGELILEQAIARAKKKGIAASGVIREGRVAEEIEGFVAEQKDLDTLVVGHMSDELREHLEPVLHQVTRRRVDVVVVRSDGARRFTLG